MTREKIGTLEDFPEDKGIEVTVNGIQIAVFNVGGKLYGMQNLCPHKRLPIHPAGTKRFVSEEIEEEDRGPEKRGGVNEDTLVVQCPWHFMEWDLETGENEPTNRRIATYEIETDGESVYAIV